MDTFGLASDPAGSSIADSSVEMHAQRAQENIFWFQPETKSWLTKATGRWKGWSTAAACRTEDLGDWTPWQSVLDATRAPFYKWYSDAFTNAAFTEVDVHVLEDHGHDIAYIDEPDPMVKQDKTSKLTWHELLLNSAAAADILAGRYALVKGDRVVLFLPTGHAQVVWIEACKRIGVIYCCCNPGLPAAQIADRICILQAKVVFTVDHPDWSYVIHEALNTFAPVGEVLKIASHSDASDFVELTSRLGGRQTISLESLPFTGDIIDVGTSLHVRVVLLDYLDMHWNSVHAKMPKPVAKVETYSIKELVNLDAQASNLSGPEAVFHIWNRLGPPVPVEANFPIFIIFTSGTTGRPKGVCHAHSCLAGLVETMKVVFNVEPGRDRMLVLASFGWITGQSYQISAPLASRVTSILLRGNPVMPQRLRFANVILSLGVTIFKAGSAFLREVMSSGEAVQELRKLHRLKPLKIGSFCAEPVSEDVHKFAIDAVCKNYVNSYWATEHGCILCGRSWDDPEQVLEANTHSWPLRGVAADVYVFDDPVKPVGEETELTWNARRADIGEAAEMVLLEPLPSMFRYIWGDIENFGKPHWQGDRATLKSYWRRARLPDRDDHWVYVQRDVAVKCADGAFTFHGRSDDVLNVKGMLFSTEHIESAILGQHPKVAQCVVVGYPDIVAGEVPLALLVPVSGERLDNEDTLRLYRLVQKSVGSVPLKFAVLSTLPRTFSGKSVRRVLKALARGSELGDTSSLSNPECIPILSAELERWRDRV